MLELNIKKIKIIISNKQEANIKKFKFYYRDKEIEKTRDILIYGSLLHHQRKKISRD